MPHGGNVCVILLIFQRNWGRDCHVTRELLALFTQGWLVDPLRVAGLTECQNGVCYWCHLGVKGGSDNS